MCVCVVASHTTLSPVLAPQSIHSDWAPHVQGLKDPEETVISKAVGAITRMCALKLFNMPKMLEFVDHILPLLFHPVRRQPVLPAEGLIVATG